jgi:methylenetetrahydrofolate dehydrogenase (NADP+)/methenyltetrahydrofolate cyclohydrolase
LDGKAVAEQILTELRDEITDFVQNNAVVPKLAAILVGDDPASQVYVRNKQRACQRVGLDSELFRLPADADQEELLKRIAKLNKDRSVHGILVQTPLPAHIDSRRVLDAVHPWKDVDAFHPENVGLLVQGRPRFLPCTPHGVLQLLRRYDLETSGRTVVVLGRSDIVGRPLANMLSQRDSTLGPAMANATVTLCHSRTQDLAKLTRAADILVAAIGQPRYLTAAMVKPGAIVVDVGINRGDEGLVGDVDFAAVREIAGFLTPVPGGVGPLTVAMLMRNTLRAANLQLP